MAMAMALAADEATTMRAACRTRYGSPEAIELTEVERPPLTDDGVLVRVRAAALNRLDWYWLTGLPLIARPDTGFFRPKSPLLGVDFAGTVEAVGPEVEDFKPGDEVFGERKGALAEYLCASAAVALKPAEHLPSSRPRPRRSAGSPRCRACATRAMCSRASRC